MPQWKSEGKVRDAILSVLKEKGSLGYNTLYEQVHSRERCGRDQFNRTLTGLVNKSVVIRDKSSAHRHGVVLRLAASADNYILGLHYFGIAESLLHILPFSDWRWGSVEEQDRMRYQTIRCFLPFKLKVELTTDVIGGSPKPKGLVAEGTYDGKGQLIDSKIRAVF